jgi:hypothetical protein
MAKITPFKRVTTTNPTDDDPGRGGIAQVPVQTPVDLIATHILRGGWRQDGQPGLRLVWRYEPAA